MKKQEEFILPDYMKLPKFSEGAFSPEMFKQAIKEGIARGNVECYTEEELGLNDEVNSPSHYTNGEIEVIDYISDSLSIEEFKGYIKGNVIKYISREAHKGKTQDMQKAEWYLHYFNTGEK